jgi:hypothetical protein
MHCQPLAPAVFHCSSTWSQFEAAIDDLIRRLMPLNPNLAWPVVGSSGLHIGSVSSGDFAFKLANISWTLVEENFSGLNGGVGAVVSNFRGGDWQDPSDWLNAAEQIDAGAFMRYLELAGGLHYLILHETAHTTELGLRTNNLQFDQYVHRGGDRYDGTAWSKSPEWLYNEQVANAIAKTVADYFSLDILEHPTCGFPDGTGAPPIRTIQNV